MLVHLTLHAQRMLSDAQVVRALEEVGARQVNVTLLARYGVVSAVLGEAQWEAALALPFVQAVEADGDVHALR